ncbi:hypothetical protein MP638_003371 [Amoeboaphelidium occidentale]|nr:hypothetical protein MP638_003371 [Amoeboaphelidium occidentale]
MPIIHRKKSYSFSTHHHHQQPKSSTLINSIKSGNAQITRRRSNSTNNTTETTLLSNEYPLLKNKYKILSVIERGLNSTVYKATNIFNSDDSILYTIKEQSTSSNDNSYQFPGNEVEILKRLNLFIDSFISKNNFYYLVYKFTPGKDLQQLLLLLLLLKEEEEDQIISATNTRFLIINNLISELMMIHSRGIIHCDLKLENILYDNETKRVSIIDYGQSEIESEMEDKGSIVRGSIEYISPEVILQSCKSSKDRDVWALGVVVYILLYNQYPFGESTTSSSSSSSNNTLIYNRICRGEFLKSYTDYTNLKQKKIKKVDDVFYRIFHPVREYRLTNLEVFKQEISNLFGYME